MGVSARLCVLQKSTDGTWLTEASNRSLLTEYRFTRAEPSDERRLRFATSDREHALEVKACREPGHGGEAAALGNG